MLLAAQATKLQSREAEAFDATVSIFRINITEISLEINISAEDIAAFRSGALVMKSGTLTKIIYALKPVERSFFFALITAQSAAENGRVKLPLLEFYRMTEGADVYRQAFKITLSTFRLEQANFSRGANIVGTNFNAWLKGNKDCQLFNLEKAKCGLTIEQRNFFDAIVNVLFCLTLPPEREGQLSLC